MDKQWLITYLDEYLDINNFEDSSKNGLQVDSSKKEIKKIWYAVDASSYIIEKAKKENVDMLLVHHGMFWWRETPIVWVLYNRVKKLIENDIALYASHLPLDAHWVIWNNAWLLQEFINLFDLEEWEYMIEKFWFYDAKAIWFWIRFEKEILFEDIVSKYTSKIGILNESYNFWEKKYIKSISFVSWGGLFGAREASNKDFDLLITGEWAHHEIMEAKELWQSIILGWHYETEKIWPKLLAKHIKDKFWVEIIYIDEKY